MKVYISGYPNNYWRASFHYNYMNKKYSYEWSDSVTPFEKRLEKLEDIVQKIYNWTINPLIKHRQRKIKVRIDPSDTWGMDNTLAYIILPMLKQLKNTKQGSPIVDDEDVPEYLRSSAAPPKESEWDLDDNHFKRWDWVLDEMIHSFECTIAGDEWEEQFHSGVRDLVMVPDEYNGTKVYRMEKGPKDTHVFDAEGHKKAWTRRSHGLKLFGKYYHNLWD